MSSPSEQTGIRFAHRVLAEATQSSLSSFHNAGFGGGVSGLSLQDVLDCRLHSTSMCIVPVKPKYAMDVKKKILYRKLKYYVTDVCNSLVSTNIEEENFWYDIGKDLGIIDKEASPLAENMYTVRFRLDKKKLMDDGRTLRDIANHFFLSPSYRHVCCSPEFISIIDIYVSDTTFFTQVMQTLETDIGIPNILEANILPDGNIITQGSNVAKVCSMKYVENCQTISNDFLDVQRQFGVEAAREVIYESVLEHVNGDTSSARMIADFMTRNGVVSGFKKDNPILSHRGFLSSLAFERPKEDIKNALFVDGSVDDLHSVYSRIITGKVPKVGSSADNFALL
jgi:hypothetical protein